MFVLSKLFGLLSSPANLLFLLLALLCLLGFTRWKAWQRPVLLAVVGGLAVIAAVPWQTILVQPLENRYPVPSLPQRVDGVIVLGGALDPVVSAARDQVAANGAIERVNALVWLRRLYPEARMVFSGGSGSVTTQDMKEAPVARRYLAELGVDPAGIVFEDQSRNTRENATYTKQLMTPAKDEVWLLVTSAMHMPRSMGAFAVVDWPVVAYPVDYLTTGTASGFSFDLGGAFNAIGNGLHEWLGLLYYRARGWTNTLFPGP
ncbi:MAG: Uncharacterized protein FD119_479 [Stygiobacter sp.]|nr:MAG: Uncharacterized protein FD119_479 [Stygiobacter sp.]